MTSRSRKDRLGRGLAALLGENLPEESEADEGLGELEVERIVPNPFQPRREFAESELKDLTTSIRANGLLQPLVVRPAGGSPDRPRYQLVAGERRLRAVRELGWERVPAVVRDVDDETLLVLALVENIQREALSPLEEAEGYQVLADEFGLTQEQIASTVGKDRSTVANMLRLLKLPPSIRKLLDQGALAMGHARALLGADDPLKASELARKAASRGWSVREVERQVRKANKQGSDESEGQEKKDPSPSGDRASLTVQALEEELRKVLSTKVEIDRKRSGDGRIVVPFRDDEDFERVFALIVGRETTEVLS
ncbi:MAG: ParB/RepB/Spo0J family partition protein [Longimicrobiales bacterium]|nr:ParB/RepB/Spo0J family partition protein [Longimicrobiales bacterium]